MNLLVLSGYTDNMEEVGRRCTATHGAYARKRGFQQETVRTYLTTSHPSHQKIRLISERIDKFDAVLWLDADSAVTNADAYTPECSGGVMDISLDWCAPTPDDLATMYVSCGNFLVRKTPDTALFMAEWARFSEGYATRPHGCWEQDGLQAAMRSSDWVNQRVNRLPRKILNSVHRSCVNGNFPDGAPDPWSPERFLVHLTNVDRISVLNSLGL